jgi:transposase-like protein
MSKYTFKQFQAEYPDDDACLRKIMEMRYGGTEFVCPGCGVDTKFHRIKKRRAFACQDCGHHIYPCVSTPFEKSRTPLTDWFFAMYLMTSTRHGVAAKELERQIGCTYKTAWRMAHELRKLMAQSDDHEPMSGHIEADETYVGGRQKGGSRGRSTKSKTVVFALVQRDGIVRAGPVPDATQFTLEPLILTNVQRGSIISTDQYGAYNDLKNSGYRHGTVNHSKKEYVRGIHHVNTLESFFAQLKRSIRGTHIHVSAKHMWKYVSEFSYRYNMRKEPESMFNRLIWGLSLPRLADD